MAALTQARMLREVTLKKIALPLAAGQVAWKNGMACADTSTNTVKRGASGNANLRNIGAFHDNVDNSAGTGTTMVVVNLDKELIGRWYDNATGAGAVASTAYFAAVYISDDHTVAASGSAEAGRAWGFDAVKGVLVVADPGAL